MKNTDSCFKRGALRKRSSSAERGRAAIRWELMLQHGGKGVRGRVECSASDFRKGHPNTAALSLGSRSESGAMESGQQEGLMEKR